MTKKRTLADTATSLPLLRENAIRVIDTIGQERNLARMSYFGALDPKNPIVMRRIEQDLTVDGSKVKSVTIIRGSEDLGLPSTPDRDKWYAFLRIAWEQKVQNGGVLENPIRFTPYRLVREMKLAKNGNIYEEIYRWGQRMTVTSITSENSIFFASKKVYRNEVVHVFSDFKRVGVESPGGQKREVYEVSLSQWMLDNLMLRYVVLEDINAYLGLKRPIAKAVFDQLHLWFHATEGGPFAKDYRDVCQLLGVNAYQYASKIRQVLDPPLQELIGIEYLSKWELQKMATKEGFKVVLWPGRQYLEIQGKNRKVERKQFPNKAEAESATAAKQSDAWTALINHGIEPEKARSLVVDRGPDAVVGALEYIDSEISKNKNKYRDAAAFLVYFLDKNLPIPATFQTSAIKREIAMQEEVDRALRAKEAQMLTGYFEWAEQQIQDAIAKSFSHAALDNKLQEMVKDLSKDPAFRKIPSIEAKKQAAMAMLKREVKSEIGLPTLEEWSLAQKMSPQIDLFDKHMT